MHRIPLLLSALLLLACSEKSGGTSGLDTSSTGDSGGATHTGDSGGDTHTGETGTPPSLHGTVPAEALPAPDFAATNYDGAARSRSDLLTNPTVMWFYPAANTSG